MSYLKLVFLIILVFGNILQTQSRHESLKEENEQHVCTRKCDSSTSPKICKYKFVVEWYLSISKACRNCPFNQTDCYRHDCVPADGKRRALISVNRRMPGPTIEVCENDTVSVLVQNDLENGEAVSIHWHGIHQRNTPFMDGVGGITQCPIPRGARFRYEFSAWPAGTHYYHSHSGLQHGDGLLGPLIVHRYQLQNNHESTNTETDGQSGQASNMFDRNCDTPTGNCEFVLTFQNWQHAIQPEMFAQEMHDGLDFSKPLSSLINGRTRGYCLHSSANDSCHVPYGRFTVTGGKRYLLRLIGGSKLNCPYKVSVDNHMLTLVSADGFNVEPRLIDALMINAGERFDVILHANHSSGSFWLKAHGVTNCYPTRSRSAAVVSYEHTVLTEPESDINEDRRGFLFNPVLTGFPFPIYRHGDPWDINPNELTSINKDDYSDEVPDVTIYTAMDFNPNDNTVFARSPYYPIDELPFRQRPNIPTFDNISFMLPPNLPILNLDDQNRVYCNRSTIDMQKCFENLCRCTHKIDIQLGQIVEMVIVNEARIIPRPGGHPVHLHGNSFRLVAYEKVAESVTLQEVRAANEDNLIPKKLISASWRDTVVVPDGGFIIIRFKADNPGYWLFHCHVEMHMDLGQTILLHVGTQEQLPDPPARFPSCQDWARLRL